MLFDRSAYTAPSKINLKLIDSNLAGQTSASVLLRSTTETNGEIITLHASSTSGVFTGTVTTVTGAAVADGRLQIAHGNLIQADYFDASAGVTRIFAAFADLLPPVISNVSVTNQFGQMVTVARRVMPAVAALFKISASNALAITRVSTWMPVT